MNKFEQMLIEPLEVFYSKVLLFLPNFLAAVALFAIGLFLAWILKLVSLKIFTGLQFDAFAERMGLKSVFEKGGIKESFSAMLAMFISTIVVFTFSVIALRALDMPAVERLLERIFLYLPNIFVALLIILFGYILSNFLGRAVLIASVNAGIRASDLISRLVKAAVILTAVTMSLEQLGIGSSTIIVAFAIVFGGIVFALGLAFGLGGRDIAADYLKKKFFEKDSRDDINHL